MPDYQKSCNFQWKHKPFCQVTYITSCNHSAYSASLMAITHGFCYWCAILIAHQIVMAKHGGSCVHFSGISTCGRTSRETVSHPQCPPLPTLCKISLPIYVIVTNIRRTYRRGYLDHAFTLHCTILPQSRATSRIAGPGGSIKCIFV